MLTNNCKKLLNSDITSITSGSIHYGVFTLNSGSFLLHNNNSINKILNSSESSDALAITQCFSILPPYVFGYHGPAGVACVKKSKLPSSVWPAARGTYVVCTYDADDAPIEPDLINVPGNDLSDALQSVTVSTQNNYVLTITFNNTSDSVMHVNRVGIYMPVQNYPPASTGNGCMLMHIFAFDDIALNPGETKSITIRPIWTN